MNIKDITKFLGLPEDASDKEIRTAFCQKIYNLKLHPDIVGGDSNEREIYEFFSAWRDSSRNIIDPNITMEQLKKSISDMEIWAEGGYTENEMDNFQRYFDTRYGEYYTPYNVRYELEDYSSLLSGGITQLIAQKTLEEEFSELEQLVHFDGSVGYYEPEYLDIHENIATGERIKKEALEYILQKRPVSSIESAQRQLAKLRKHMEKLKLETSSDNSKLTTAKNTGTISEK